jgi:hypothetical protein
MRLTYNIHMLVHHYTLYDNNLLNCSLSALNFSAGFATPLEHLVLMGVMSVPLIGACLVGHGSMGLIFSYILVFDFLRGLGNSNVEVFPVGPFEAFPALRYLIYTPT